MKVAMVNLTSGGLSGGYVKYLQALVPLLRRDSRISRLDVFVPDSASLGACEPLHTWPARDRFAARRLRREIESLQPDVVFFPTARLLDCGRIPTMVMVRNMEPLTVPFGGNTLRESLRNVARARVARGACRRATRIIAVSRHVQRFLTERWHVPEERIGLVYHGIDAPNGRTVSMPAALVGLERFVFTAGSIRPARGLEDLVRAAPALVGQHPLLKIVIAGKADASTVTYEARMRRLAATLGVSDAIVWAGHLSPSEMAWAFSECAAFAVTSRAEACPNIALEALSHGVRVISTSQEPMPEFFGETAAYYEPKDASGLARRLVEIISEPPDAAMRRRAAAQARGAAFPWSRTADETIVQLQAAANHR